MEKGNSIYYNKKFTNTRTALRMVIELKPGPSIRVRNFNHVSMHKQLHVQGSKSHLVDIS